MLIDCRFTYCLFHRSCHLADFQDEVGLGQLSQVRHVLARFHVLIALNFHDLTPGRDGAVAQSVYFFDKDCTLDGAERMIGASCNVPMIQLP
ncbi:hypothetical protein Y032_0341g3014 [Ancylostoma ceylanicum]|uniref:Uncharacterized protein n=1 Tax=Ancylostoma ceylanicum TaxID=53326 RepID=A0A016RYW0_9BILA|nr:hypothetical protein Y032_0341g3014 [Ancylostoma ceylanicum]